MDDKTDDKTITHHLWWLRKYLNDQFQNKEYKQVIYEELSIDICKEVDALVAHIKENY